MKIERPKLSEAADILRFLEDAYGFSAGFFERAYPNCFKNKNRNFHKNTFIIKDDGEISSLVRLFALDTLQNGAPVKLAGIGNVATAYAHRGKGYMTKLMQYAFAEMEKQKYPLSVLTGDRHRYGRMGYENGGKVVELEVSARGLAWKGIKPAPAKMFFRGDRTALSNMIKAFNGLNYRKKRTTAEFMELCSKQNRRVYYAEERGKFAYLNLASAEAPSPGSRRVFECAGDSKLIIGILKYLVERFKYTGFSLRFPDFCDIPEEIMFVSSSWKVKQELMVKIISLRRTLEAFSRGNKFFFPEGEELTLAVRGKESVVINRKNGCLEIKNGKGCNEVILDEAGMVRLLFGVSCPAVHLPDSAVVQLLRQFLPFNLFLGRPDYI